MLRFKLSKLKKLFRQQPILIFIVIWYSLMWSWVLFTDALELTGGRVAAGLMAGIVLIVNVALSSVIMWQAVRLADRLAKRYRIRYWLPLALGVFALAEFLVSWLVALFWIGPEGSLDSTLPISSAGLVLIQTPIRFAARFVGLYGLAAFGWLIIWLVLQKKFRLVSWLLAFLLMISLPASDIYQGRQTSMLISATIIRESIGKRVPPISDQTNLVIFPEYGLNEINDKNLGQRIEPASKDAPSTMFVGSMRATVPNEVGYRNILVFGETGSGIISSQSKHRLIPGGEDMPYIARGILSLAGQSKTLDYFEQLKRINKGDQPLANLEVDPNTIIGPGLCSSITAPADYRQQVKQGATLLTNSASLTVFNGSRLFAWQQKSLAKFNAVANARYFLQSANAAEAFAFDTGGRQIASAKDHSTTTLEVQNSQIKTPYSLVGEWLVWVGLLAVAIEAMMVLKVKKLKGKQK